MPFLSLRDHIVALTFLAGPSKHGCKSQFTYAKLLTFLVDCLRLESEP
jgi:hypothetical protein